jgi:hypothetical protein
MALSLPEPEELAEPIQNTIGIYPLKQEIF